MRCPNCSMESDGNFCSSCGTSLKNSSAGTMQASTKQIPPAKPPSNNLAFKIGCGCLLVIFAFLFMLGLIGSLIYPHSTDLSLTSTDNRDTPEPSTATPSTTATSLKSSSGFVAATVMRVIDGDTIEVNVSKKTYRVRLIGIDTPEINDPRKSVQLFAVKASDYTTNSLSKRVVYLEYDTQNKDKYGRKLAYVWLSKPVKINDANIRAKMFNADLLLNGYAQITTIPPNVKYADYFKDYQNEARKKEVGLWKKSTTTTTVRQTTTTEKTIGCNSATVSYLTLSFTMLLPEQQLVSLISSSITKIVHLFL